MFRQAAQSVVGVAIVGEAGDGAAAVELCLKEQPAAVILDVDMPVMDGVESLARIRAALPDVKIAMFSGDDTAQAAAFERGANAYFLKADTSPTIILEHLAALCAPDDSIAVDLTTSTERSAAEVGDRHEPYLHA
jgi:DNA-binding NarL/FixJ family response regulator